MATSHDAKQNEMAKMLPNAAKAQAEVYLKTETMVTSDAQRKRAMRRLLLDLQELKQSPVTNVSAEPLESDMFEWHCNIRQEDIIYHLVLFLPDSYPYDSPSAEFLPVGFMFSGGATIMGKKGVKVCLNIFSDFAKYHTEWAGQKGFGWSPGYTIQTVLMNLVAFLAETAGKDLKAVHASLSKTFTCKDCGHSHSKPFPPLDVESQTSAAVKGKETEKLLRNSNTKKSLDGCPEIIDYISKERFVLKQFESREDLFGYGLVVSGPQHRPSLTTPCEYLTAESFFAMQASVGTVHSTLKEKLSFFLPMYIHPLHGSKIQKTFEETINEVRKILPTVEKTTRFEEVLLKTIPNLMAATVVEFSKGTQHTSDNSLTGYFALHRLLLWALESYPDLQQLVDMKLKEFMENEAQRTKIACPHIGEWLMLLSASEKYRWQDAADAYLSESFRRNVMWYVKDNKKLGFLNTPMEYRLSYTFDSTTVSRKILAFQVLFLDIAQPSDMSRKEVVERYDSNYCLPTKEMVEQMKEACSTVNNDMNTYEDWFKVLKLEPWDAHTLFDKLVESVKYSIETPGYHWTLAKGAGGWTNVLRRYREKEEEMKKAAKSKEGEIPAEECVDGPWQKTSTSKGKGRGKKSKGDEDQTSDDEEKRTAGPGSSESREAEAGAIGKGDEESNVPKGRGRGRGGGRKRGSEVPAVWKSQSKRARRS